MTFKKFRRVRGGSPRLLKIGPYWAQIDQNRGKSDLKKVQWATLTNSYINFYVMSFRVVWSLGEGFKSKPTTSSQYYLLNIRPYWAKIGKNDPKSASEQGQWPQNPVKTDHFG